MSGELSHRNLIRSLLKFDNLLVDKLRTLVNDNIWVHWTLIVSRHLHSITDPRKRNASEAASNRQNLCLVAISALNVKRSCFRGQDRGANDNAWDSDESRDCDSIEIADGSFALGGVKQKLVLGNDDVLRGGVHNAMSASLQGSFELYIG